MTDRHHEKKTQASAGAAALARCERRCRDLGDQLRQALAEQARIRCTLQARLLASSEQAEQARSEWEMVRDEMRVERTRIEAESQAQVAAFQAERDQLQTQMAMVQAERNQFQAQVKTLHAERDQLHQEMAARALAAEEKQARAERERESLHEAVMAEQQRLLTRLESELRGVYQSFSWRLTAPLRWINRPIARRSSR